MQREEFDRLLAGYATKQNSAKENTQLIEAAMADQALFNALADEDALRDLVQDPRGKAELLQALTAVESTSFWSWLRRPQLWALTGAAAVAALALFIYVRPQQEPVREVAVAKAPAPLAQSPASVVEDKAPAQPPALPQRRKAKVATVREDKPAEALKDVDLKMKKETAPAELAASGTAGKAASMPAASAPTQPPAVSAFRAAEADAVSANMGRLAKSTASPPVQYKVLRKNAQGEFVETATGAALAKGDAIRLAVTASAKGYLSLTDIASNRLLSGTPAEPGQRYLLPVTGEIKLEAGTEKRLRLLLVDGVYGGAAQAPGAQSMLRQEVAKQGQQQAAPILESTVEVVIRFR